MPNHPTDYFGICVDVANSSGLVLGGVLIARKEFVCVHRGVLHWGVAEAQPVVRK